MRLLPPILAAVAIACAPRVLAEPAGRAVDPIRESFVQPSAEAQALDHAIEHYSSLGFSGVVFVAKDGLVLLHKGFGKADRSTGEPNGPRTGFPIGPMSRIFIAAAVLRLQMDGKIETSDAVTKYLPDFRDAPQRPGTTVHDLLAGGDADYKRLPEIIEKASGESFEGFLAARLFAPARMRDSWFVTDPPADRGSIARGYAGSDVALRRLTRIPGFRTLLPVFAGSLRSRADRLAPVPLPPDRIDPQARHTTGMFTTSGDLFMWSFALMGDTVLSGEARTQIFNPIDNTVSYGWKLERTDRGTPRMSSTGDIAGYQSGMWIYPSDNLVLIVLANNDMGWREAVRRTVEASSLGRNYTVLYLLGGVLLLYLVMQGAMRRRVPYRKGRHPRAYP